MFGKILAFHLHRNIGIIHGVWDGSTSSCYYPLSSQNVFYLQKSFVFTVYITLNTGNFCCNTMSTSIHSSSSSSTFLVLILFPSNLCPSRASLTLSFLAFSFNLDNRSSFPLFFSCASFFLTCCFSSS